MTVLHVKLLMLILIVHQVCFARRIVQQDRRMVYVVLVAISISDDGEKK